MTTKLNFTFNFISNYLGNNKLKMFKWEIIHYIFSHRRWISTFWLMIDNAVTCFVYFIEGLWRHIYCLLMLLCSIVYFFTKRSRKSPVCDKILYTIRYTVNYWTRTDHRGFKKNYSGFGLCPYPIWILLALYGTVALGVSSEKYNLY